MELRYTQESIAIKSPHPFGLTNGLNPNSQYQGGIALWN